MIVLALQHVTKARGKGARAVEALREVNLQLPLGEILLIEGPSGSGKTTLLTVAAGLLTPDEGRVIIAGERIDHYDPVRRAAMRANSVGFVFQRANLLESLTVLENILLAGAVASMSKTECEAEARQLLDKLDIATLADRYPSTLSGGEEHRVALARGVIHRPVVVFADEPTGNLDATTGDLVADALRELASSHGVAILLASHDRRLRRIANRSLNLVDGRLVASPEESA
jgi:putative ABC transport system ATP-binding protein